MNNKSSKITMLFLVLLSAVSGGGISVFGKIALDKIPSFSFTFLRFLGATTVLLPFFLRSRPKYSSDIYKLLLFNLLATANVLLFSFGIKSTSASVTQAIYSGGPLLAAIFSFYLLQERFTSQKMLGLLIGFLGTSIVVLFPVFSNIQTGSITLFGNSLILIATLAYSGYLVLSKKIQDIFSPIQIIFYFALTTTYLTAILATWDLVRFPSWWEQLTYREIGSTLYVSVIGTAFFYLINQIIIQKSTPVISSLTLYLQPLATFVWAFALLGEKLSSVFMMGFGLCMLGVYLVSTAKTKKDEPQTQSPI